MGISPEHSAERASENFPDLEEIKKVVVKLHGSYSNFTIEENEKNLNNIPSKVSIVFGDEASGNFVRYVYEKKDAELLIQNSKLAIGAIYKWQYTDGIASGTKVAEYTHNQWLEPDSQQPL